MKLSRRIRGLPVLHGKRVTGARHFRLTPWRDRYASAKRGKRRLFSVFAVFAAKHMVALVPDRLGARAGYAIGMVLVCAASTAPTRGPPLCA